MNNPKIMVVDDDEKILFAFQQVLAKEGHICIEAKTGTDAVLKFSLQHPQIVFLDITLPDVNGLAVLSRMKQIDESIPVVAISSQKTDQDEMKAMRLGAYDFLSKPLSVAKIREILNKNIQHKENGGSQPKTEKGPEFSKSKEHVLNTFEKQFISQQLARHNGNITAAAKASQMSRQNFYRLLIKHQIKPN